MNQEIKSSLTDEWYTSENTVEQLIPYIPKEFKNILCPFSWDDSAFPTVLAKYGYNVKSSHYEKGSNLKNFFDYTKEELKEIDCIIDNPPYSIRNNVMDKLFEFDKPYILLLPFITVTKASVRKRIEEFNFLLFKKRQNFKNQEGKLQGSPYDTAFFLFLKEYQSGKQLKVLDYKGYGWIKEKRSKK